MIAMTMRISYRLGVAAVLCGLLAGCGERKSPVSSIPDRTFATPEEAVAALVAAADSFNVPELKAILGREGEPLVATADTVADRNHAAAFVAQAHELQRIELDSAGTSATLFVGPGDWPMPIPIVEQNGRWHFDAAAGAEEILLRRVGQNELDAITVSQGFVEAERAYADARHDGSMVNQYAQRIISTPGKQDGLAWQTADGAWEGPVGENVARFITEGYSDRSQPFHGYYYKVLKGQGPAATQGAINFMVGGAMIGGYALVAAPAEYGVTGIQTFIVSWEGVVYEKDLGDQTLETFRTMELYNPDSTWTAVGQP
jgi:hypothetical protein